MTARVIPPYCSNCQHKQVCEIQINIVNMDKQTNDFNQAHDGTLQSVSSINYNCGFKLKTV